VALHQFGDVAHRRGNLEEALDWYRKSLDISKGVVRRPDMARTYEALGIVHSELGNHEEALLCLLQGLVLRLEMKAPLRPTLDQIKQQRRALGETAYQEVLRKADGLTRRSEEVVAAIEAE
jgi:tetratricopeptide (TPR) repeat protein